MATSWEVPEGYKLTVIPGYHVNERNFLIHPESEAERRIPTADQQVEVFYFDEDMPFIWRVNDGMGPNASQEARDAVKAGKPLAGYSPFGHFGPRVNGWVPPQYVLQHEDDETVGTVEPHELAHVTPHTPEVIS